MKIIYILLISTLIFSDQIPLQGLERASATEQRDACALAKEQARKNYKLIDLNVGCTCEKSSPHQWICFVGFEYILENK